MPEPRRFLNNTGVRGVDLLARGAWISLPTSVPNPGKLRSPDSRTGKVSSRGPRLRATRCGCSEAGRQEFLLRCVREASAGAGGSELEIGARGAARAPPGGPRGAGRAGKGLHVPGRLAPGGHVMRRPNDRAGAAAASAAGSGRPGAAGVSRRGRPRPAKPWAPSPRRRRPAPGRTVSAPRVRPAAGRTRAPSCEAGLGGIISPTSLAGDFYFFTSFCPVVRRLSV